jgi:hypothetical protein
MSYAQSLGSYSVGTSGRGSVKIDGGIPPFIFMAWCLIKHRQLHLYQTVH